MELSGFFGERRISEAPVYRLLGNYLNKGSEEKGCLFFMVGFSFL